MATPAPELDYSLQDDSTTKMAPAAKPTTLMGKISRVIWDRDDKSEEERKFVQRLDLGLMTMICVSYWVKYLDQANVANAYVSGMKEDLNFTGNEYNTLISCWTAGYTVGQFFSTLIMVKVGPAIWLPSCEILWTIFVMVCSVAKTPQALMGLRFVIGFFESAAYPGGIWLLGSWYNKHELGKRSVIFICCSSVGYMFSGYLQTAVLHLEGVGGKAGWQWLFVMDGVIGLPIAIVGFFVFPGTPDRPNKLARWWLRQKDIDMGKARMDKIGRQKETGFTVSKFRSAFSNPYLWLFAIPYVSSVLGLSSYAYFNLWLKATKLYTTAQINLIPTGGYGLQVVCALMYSWITDAIGRRWPVIMFAATIALVGSCILAAWPASNHAKFAGFFLSYTVVGNNALILSWANELVSQHSAEHRAITLGFLNTISYVFNSWVPNLAFPASKAPHYPVGYKLTAGLWGVNIIGIGCIALYAHYHPKAEEPLVADYDYQQEGSIPEKEEAAVPKA